MIVPVYLSEMAPASVRGRLNVTNVLFITGGQFLASVLCGALGDQWRCGFVFMGHYTIKLYKHIALGRLQWPVKPV